MQVNKKVSVAGQWAKLGRDFNENDTLTILDDGQMVTGEYGDRLAFKVKTPKGDLNMSFNQTTQNHLIDAWGKETAEWKGKEVKVWIVDQNVQGKIRAVVYLTPTDWRKVRNEAGELKFLPPQGQEIKYPAEEVTPDDIPF